MREKCSKITSVIRLLGRTFSQCVLVWYVWAFFACELSTEAQSTHWIELFYSFHVPKFLEKMVLNYHFKIFHRYEFYLHLTSLPDLHRNNKSSLWVSFMTTENIIRSHVHAGLYVWPGCVVTTVTESAKGVGNNATASWEISQVQSFTWEQKSNSIVIFHAVMDSTNQTFTYFCIFIYFFILRFKKLTEQQQEA